MARNVYRTSLHMLIRVRHSAIGYSRAENIFVGCDKDMIMAYTRCDSELMNVDTHKTDNNGSARIWKCFY